MFYVDWCNNQTNPIVKYRDIIRIDKSDLFFGPTTRHVGHTVLSTRVFYADRIFYLNFLLVLFHFICYHVLKRFNYNRN